MTLGHGRFRRQHAGTAHRRAPAPQLGFDPDAFRSRTKADAGGFTDIFPATFSPLNVDPFPTPAVPMPQPVVPTTTTQVVPSTTSTTTTTTTSSSASTSIVVTPTTTTSSTPVVVPPTTTSTPVVTTTLPPKTAIVTNTVPHTSTSNTAAAASVSASASSIPETTSSVSTGALAGGIVAGILAILAIILAIVFFIRRSRKRDSFNEVDFRRSAMVLDDPPTHEDTVARGFNPAPPVMIERQTASPAPTFGTKYGHPGALAYGHDEYATNNAGYGASTQQSFAPGQVINVNSAPAHPMYTPQSPYEQYHPQNVPSPILTRQGSNTSAEGHYQAHSPTETKRESLPANDYVDLSRSSVSPFQAAQYVEISRRLNTEVPEGLRTADIDRDLPPLPTDDHSPFDDPASAPPSPGAQYAIDRRNLEPTHSQEEDPIRRVSTDSLATNEQTLEFPVPPSPVMTPTSRYRIESLPPMLPEINVESRVSVGGYPLLSARDSGAPSGMMLTPGLASASGSRFPMTPSPLASSFGMPSPMPAAAFPNEAPPTPRTPPVVPQDPKKRETTYSMYDPEDAYGGI